MKLEREFCNLTTFGIFAGFLAGVLIPVQTTINSGLIDPLGNIIAPAAASFITGAFLLSFTFPYDGRKKTDPEEKKSVKELLKDLDLYLVLLPGFIGAYYVAMGAIMGKNLGVNLFFVSSVVGQLFAATIADEFGWFGVNVEKITKFRMVCLVVVIAGAILTVYERLSVDEDIGKVVGFIILSLSAGFLLTLQVPMNAKVQKKMRSLPHRASWWSFIMGSIYLIILTWLTGYLPSVDRFHFQSLKGIDFWRFVGGPIGAVYVTLAIILGPRLGLSLFFVCVIAGQLLSSLVIYSRVI